MCFELLQNIYDRSLQITRLWNAIEKAILCCVVDVDVVRQMYVDVVWNFIKVSSCVQSWT